jgi:hypothetical protein
MATREATQDGHPGEEHPHAYADHPMGSAEIVAHRAALTGKGEQLGRDVEEPGFRKAFPDPVPEAGEGPKNLGFVELAEPQRARGHGMRENIMPAETRTTSGWRRLRTAG